MELQSNVKETKVMSMRTAATFGVDGEDMNFTGIY